jgi:hypothetical protein
MSLDGAAGRAEPVSGRTAEPEEPLPIRQQVSGQSTGSWGRGVWPTPLSIAQSCPETRVSGSDDPYRSKTCAALRPAAQDPWKTSRTAAINAMIVACRGDFHRVRRVAMTIFVGQAELERQRLGDNREKMQLRWGSPRPAVPSMPRPVARL